MLRIIEHRKFRKLRRNPRLFFKDSKANLYWQRQKQKVLARQRIRQRFFWLVVLPFMASVLYYGLIASPRYSSEAQLIIRRIGDVQALPLSGLSLLGPSSDQYSDAMLVREYMLSMDMMKHLDQSIDLRRHFASDQGDFLSRLASNASQEEAYAYYQSRVSVNFNELSGVLSIEAQGFSPEFARTLVETMTKASEDFLNQINRNLAIEQLHFVEEELQRAQTQLKKSKTAMMRFQENHQMVHPEQQSQAAVSVVNELSSELTRLEAELKTLMGYMNPNAPQVAALENRIAAIRGQLEGENSEFVGQDENSLSQLTAEFQSLVLDYNFAQDAYKTALTSLEKARLDSSQKKKHLVVVSPAYKPEEARYPRRIRHLITIFLGLLILYGITVLTAEIIKENRL